VFDFERGEINVDTSKSNSSGPAIGSKMYGSASIPGAVVIDETVMESALRIALCPGAWNEQFLEKSSLLVLMGRKMSALDC